MLQEISTRAVAKEKEEVDQVDEAGYMRNVDVCGSSIKDDGLMANGLSQKKVQVDDIMRQIFAASKHACMQIAVSISQAD